MKAFVAIMISSAQNVRVWHWRAISQQRYIAFSSAPAASSFSSVWVVSRYVFFLFPSLLRASFITRLGRAFFPPSFLYFRLVLFREIVFATQLHLDRKREKNGARMDTIPWRCTSITRVSECACCNSLHLHRWYSIAFHAVYRLRRHYSQMNPN